MGQFKEDINTGPRLASFPGFGRLSLGTAALGMEYGATNTRGPIPLGEFDKILNECQTAGIRSLDTAQSYGQAEEMLGRCGVSEFSITTKVILRKTEKAGSVLEKARASMQRLQVKKLAGMLLHNEERLEGADKDAVASALQRLKTLGLVERVGISSYEPARALKLCEKHGFDVVQLPFSVLDTRILQEDVLQRLLGRGIEVQARSVFLQGTLLGMPKEGCFVPQRVLTESALFRAKCKEQELNPLSAALAYLLAASPSIKIVIGITGQDELASIIRALPKVKLLENYESPTWTPEFDPRNWKK